MKKIAIYPGHVGKDSGAIDPADGPHDTLHTIEAVVTWGVASKLAGYLSTLGMDYRLQTGSFATRIAGTADCDVGVSIHADAIGDQSIHGYHCIYHHGSKQGQRLAYGMHAALGVRFDPARSPHARRDLAILRDTAFPVVLIECGFLTNPDEEGELTQDRYQYQLAWAIAEGLRRWVYAC